MIQAAAQADNQLVVQGTQPEECQERTVWAVAAVLVEGVGYYLTLAAVVATVLSPSGCT